MRASEKDLPVQRDFNKKVLQSLQFDAHQKFDFESAVEHSMLKVNLKKKVKKSLDWSYNKGSKQSQCPRS